MLAYNSSKRKRGIEMTLPDSINFEDEYNEGMAAYDEDQAYDAWVDDIVGDYFYRLKERQELYKKLLLCEYHGNHNIERDNLEKELLRNLTGTDQDWIEDAGDPRNIFMQCPKCKRTLKDG